MAYLRSYKVDFLILKLYQSLSATNSFSTYQIISSSYPLYHLNLTFSLHHKLIIYRKDIEIPKKIYVYNRTNKDLNSKIITWHIIYKLKALYYNIYWHSWNNIRKGYFSWKSLRWLLIDSVGYNLIKSR